MAGLGTNSLGINAHIWISIRVHASTEQNLNKILESLKEFSESVKVEEVVFARISISDAVELRLQCLFNSNSISGHSKPIVEAADIFTDIAIWVIGASVSEVNDINAVGSGVETTGLCEHKIADTLCSTTSVSVAGARAVEVIIDITHGLTGSNTATTCVVVTVKAELHVVLVIKGHHSHFDWVAEEHNKVTQSFSDPVESGFRDASGSVQNKENVLHAVGEAVGLAPVAGSVLGNVEWNWVHSQWLWGCRTARFSEVWSSFLFQN